MHIAAHRSFVSVASPETPQICGNERADCSERWMMVIERVLWSIFCPTRSGESTAAEVLSHVGSKVSRCGCAMRHTERCRKSRQNRSSDQRTAWSLRNSNV